MIRTDDASLKGHFSLFVAYVIFGLSAPIGKSAMIPGGVEPLALVFFRMTGAAILFWTASLAIPRERVRKKDLILLLGASLFGMVINQICFIVGLSKSSPVDVSLIATLGPIITMLVSAAYLKEPITFKKVLGVLVGASGVLLLILSGAESIKGKSHLAGNILCLLSSLSFAIYLTLFRDLIKRYSSITLMKWMFLFAALISFPICHAKVEMIDYKSLSINVYLSIIYIVCFATFLSYMLLPVGQKTLRPTIVSMYNYLQPLVGSVVAVAMGLGLFGWKEGAASVLVFLGVFIVTQSKSRYQMQRG